MFKSGLIQLICFALPYKQFPQFLTNYSTYIFWLRLIFYTTHLNLFISRVCFTQQFLIFLVANLIITKFGLFFESTKDKNRTRHNTMFVVRLVDGFNISLRNTLLCLVAVSQWCNTLYVTLPCIQGNTVVFIFHSSFINFLCQLTKICIAVNKYYP